MVFMYNKGIVFLLDHIYFYQFSYGIIPGKKKDCLFFTRVLIWTGYSRDNLNDEI